MDVEIVAAVYFCAMDESTPDKKNHKWYTDLAEHKKEPFIKMTKTKTILMPQFASKRKILFLTFSAVVCLVATGILISSLIDPIDIIAKYRTRLTVGSPLHKLFQGTIPSIEMHTYFFNITNSERFLSGKDEKLSIEEVGPFVYLEHRTNEDLELDVDAGILRYTPTSTRTFLPERSIANPKDVYLMLPNIAVLGVTSVVSTYAYFTRLGFNVLSERLDLQPILNVSVHDYLFGYKDPLISLGNKFMPSWIYFDVIGIFDRMYDPRRSYRLEVSTRNHDKFEIKLRNGQKGLSMWGYDDPEKRTSCNSFENVYEGVGYPMDLTPDVPLRFYHDMICRFMDLEYVETTVTDYGSDALRFRFKDDVYVMDENKTCYCSKGSCINGASDVSPCYFDFPFSVSDAHFTGADPKIYEHIEGLKPDPVRFESRFLIEPRLGVALDTSFSIQINMMMRDVSFNGKVKRFSDMLVPLGFIHIKQPELLDQIKSDLNLMCIIGPKLLLAIEIVLFLSSLFLLAYSARLIYLNWVYSNNRSIDFDSIADKKAQQSLIVNLGS